MGEIYVSSEIEQQRAGQQVPGGMTMRLWAENGQLQAQVTTLEFSGWDASQEQLNNINQSPAEGLSRQASRNSQSELSQVVVRDGELVFTFKTPRRR